jgi:hypothetical protein
MKVGKWLAHFRGNRAPVEVDWSAPLELPSGQRDALAGSLAVFQLGETGTGGTLRRYAVRSREWAGFQGYEEALGLFIAEENRHAEWLGQMVDRLQGERITEQWTASVFKVLRRPLNLQFELQILLTAELIAEAYYELLRRSLFDAVLKKVCARILKDEVAHTRFHADFFGAVQARWSLPFVALWRMQFHGIHRLTSEVVWWDHLKCFRQLGVRRREYLRLCRRARATFLQGVERARVLGAEQSEAESLMVKGGVR